VNLKSGNGELELAPLASMLGTFEVTGLSSTVTSEVSVEKVVFRIVEH